MSLRRAGHKTPARHGNSPAQKQAEVVDRGRSVMPFDIRRTMHHFRKSPSGGVEEVLSTGVDARRVEKSSKR